MALCCKSGMAALFIACTIPATPCNGQPHWISLEEAPYVERDDAVAVWLGNYGYVGTGLTPWWEVLGDWWRYHPASNQWDAMTPLAGMPRQYASAFVIDQKAYITGGVGQDYFNDLWAYDPVTNEWEVLAPMPAEGKAGQTVFVLNGCAYLCGGIESGGIHSAEVWRYCPAENAWDMMPALPVALRLAAGFTIEDQGYVVGGFTPVEGGLSSCYRFNLQTMVWSTCAQLPSPRLDPAVGVWMNMGLVIGGGTDWDDLSNTVYAYSQDTDSWATMGAFPGGARKGGVAMSHNDILYCGTGIGNPPENQRFNDWFAFGKSVSVQEPEWVHWEMFPNPTKDRVVLQGPTGWAGELLVFNALGRVVFQQSISSERIEIATRDWSSGCYVVSVISNGALSNQRLLVIR